ncbi:MAG: MFS transporter [Sphingobacteriia bacterium]|nr:MFS transporter [Sphingobacteriia bacterium]
MRKVVTAGIIGNALEWYDFALYVHFVEIISRLYFPSDDIFLSRMATYAAFAAGFFMRPLGAILFGYIGDKFGRRQALSASILTMAIPTSFIAILPSYQEVGMIAPICLVIIRLLQGLSLGGEFSGSIAFVVEHAPDNKRGLAGSSAMFSMNLGILAGSAVAAICANFMSPESFNAWGWRVPFGIGLVIGLVGLYIRSNLHESPKYEEAKAKGLIAKAPTRKVLTDFPVQLITAICLYLTVTVPFYTFVSFMKSFMTTFVGRSVDEASIINSITMLIATAFIPIVGYMSDVIGRKVVIRAAALGFLLLAYPCFILLKSHDFFSAFLGQLIFGMLVSLYMAPIPTILVELFPTSVRYTGVALSYNISAAIFGGTVPMVATFLIEYTGIKEALAFYIMFFALISLISIYYLEDRRKVALA